MEKKDITQPFSLDTAMKQLEQIESYFQQPTINLEEALGKHKEAITLANAIFTYLETTENTLQHIDLKNTRVKEPLDK